MHNALPKRDAIDSTLPRRAPEPSNHLPQTGALLGGTTSLEELIEAMPFSPSITGRFSLCGPMNWSVNSMTVKNAMLVSLSLSLSCVLLLLLAAACCCSLLQMEAASSQMSPVLAA